MGSKRVQEGHAIRADGEWLTEFEGVVVIGSAKPYVDDWFVEKIYVYVMRIDVTDGRSGFGLRKSCRSETGFTCLFFCNSKQATKERSTSLGRTS